MYIRDSKTEDKDEILRVYKTAIKFMRSYGNIYQWPDDGSYLNEEQVLSDIAKGISHVVIENNKIVAVFALILGIDKTYIEIDGKWLDDEKPYGTVHRIASDQSCHGIFDLCLSWCLSRIDNIRIDTHSVNIPMRTVLQRNGFIHCGTIICSDGTPRMAFQKIGRFKLLEPTYEHCDAIEEYKKEFIQSGDSADGTGAHLLSLSAREWVEYSRQFLNEETCPFGMVPAVQYIYLNEDTGKIVGMIQARLGLNAYLLKYGLHIGYSVAPGERRKGYAKSMLKLVLPLYKEKGFEKVGIACYSDNEASRRTILRCGGVYENTVHDDENNRDLERYWIELKDQIRGI